ncbi:MAG TPA: hypothetical protein VGB13_04595 [Candidatus Krumholzibacteria bacterium]
MKNYQSEGSGLTVTLTIAEARGPGLEHAVRVLRLELGDGAGIWVEEFTSESEADLFLCGCRAALHMKATPCGDGARSSARVGGFPTSVQQIINFGKTLE